MSKITSASKSKQGADAVQLNELDDLISATPLARLTETAHVEAKGLRGLSSLWAETSLPLELPRSRGGVPRAGALDLRGQLARE